METIETMCPNCGSDELSWCATSHNKSLVDEGRLRTHEVESLFVLGCDECSETVRIVSADDVAELLNELLRPKVADHA